MERFLCGIAAVTLAAVMASTPAFAWGPDGHREVGSLADRMLKDHPNALAQVKSILGPITLADAGPWGDCVRSVSGPDDGFKYTHSDEFGAPCVVFEKLGRSGEMEDYVRRNWSSCTYKGDDGCHTQYHFTDLALERSEYRMGLVGTYDYDIVHAINAAVATLRDQPTTAPFNFTKRDALMMLVHFLGDIHQPLHVGSLYLDKDGNPVDPDASQFERDRAEKVTSTFGGNSLTWMGNGHLMKLHSVWDGVKVGDYALADARKEPVTRGDPTGWATSWATESLSEAQTAFVGLTFGARGKKGWPVRFTNASKYQADRDAVQRQRIEKGGARLTQVLLDIWPDAGSSAVQ
jgi:S1/P1 Nuclease